MNKIALMLLSVSFMFCGLAQRCIAAGQWVNVGPAPIDANNQPNMGEGHTTGRIRALAVDPNDNNHWLLGAASGGVWETRDAGKNWVPRTDDQPSLGMGAIAFAPSVPSIVYAGTGEPLELAGPGLLKSTDGGSTWRLLGAAWFAKTAFSNIEVDPANPNVVLAATTCGREGEYTVCYSQPTGVLKSTDGGQTWTFKIEGHATDLQVDPQHFNRQYAALGNIFGGQRNGVYRSTDTGENWRRVNGPWGSLAAGVGRIELAIAPSKPDVLYVIIQDAQNGIGNDSDLLGIWRTDNAWADTPTWRQIQLDPSLGFRCNQQCQYDLAITVDPNNENTVYAGGVDLYQCSNCGGSTSKWTFISGPIHVDHHIMAWARNRLLVGNDGGIYSTADGGKTWSDHNTNLSLTQFYFGSVHPTNPNFMLGGTQDNGSPVRTDSDVWTDIFDADGAANAIASGKPYKPETHWAVSTQNQSIYRTIDGGKSFIGASGIQGGQNVFIGSFAKCPNNDEVFIAGTNQVFKSTSFFSSSQPFFDYNNLTMPIVTDSNGQILFNQISALAFAPSDRTCNTYAVGGLYSHLRLTVDGGAHWSDINSGSSIPFGLVVTALSFDPSNPNILYVTTVGGANGNHAFKTTNALSPSPTWAPVGPPIDTPHRAIVVDPLNANIVYVGTQQGVWQSIDGAKSWTKMGPGNGMPNVQVYDLQANTLGDVFAFTYGRGVFALKDVVNQAVTFAPVEPFSSDADPTGCPPGFVGHFRFNAVMTGKEGIPDLSDLMISVRTLTGGDLIRKPDASLGAAGTTFPVGKIDGYSDGFLTAGESVRVPFSFCLKDRTRFTFFVDVLGTTN